MRKTALQVADRHSGPTGSPSMSLNHVIEEEIVVDIGEVQHFLVQNPETASFSSLIKKTTDF
jgi:hypothetical protein